MIILPGYSMRELMTAVVNATHGLVNAAGEPVVVNTIDEARLRMAAVCAIQIATGESVFPGDKRLVIEQQRQETHVMVEIQQR
jgi:hypothetical protein